MFGLAIEIENSSPALLAWLGAVLGTNLTANDHDLQGGSSVSAADPFRDHACWWSRRACSLGMAEIGENLLNLEHVIVADGWMRQATGTTEPQRPQKQR